MQFHNFDAKMLTKITTLKLENWGNQAKYSNFRGAPISKYECPDRLHTWGYTICHKTGAHNRWVMGSWSCVLSRVALFIIIYWYQQHAETLKFLLLDDAYGTQSWCPTCKQTVSNPRSTSNNAHTVLRSRKTQELIAAVAILQMATNTSGRAEPKFQVVQFRIWSYANFDWSLQGTIGTVPTKDLCQCQGVPSGLLVASISCSSEMKVFRKK